MKISLAFQPAQSGDRVDHRNWDVGKSCRITGHDGIAAAGLGRSSAHCIFKIGPRERERAPHDRLIYGRDAKHTDQPLDTLSGERSAASFLYQIEDRRDSVSGDQTSSLAGFDCSPNRCGRIGIRATIQEYIEDHIEVEKERLHRYFRAR